MEVKIIEIIKVLSIKGNTARVLLKVKWGKNPPTIDIRKMDASTLESNEPKFFKGGITLDDDDLSTLGEALVDLGYIDSDFIKESEEAKINTFLKKNKIHVRMKK